MPRRTHQRLFNRPQAERDDVGICNSMTIVGLVGSVAFTLISVFSYNMAEQQVAPRQGQAYTNQQFTNAQQNAATIRQEQEDIKNQLILNFFLLGVVAVIAIIFKKLNDAQQENEHHNTLG